MFGGKRVAHGVRNKKAVQLLRSNVLRGGAKGIWLAGPAQGALSRRDLPNTMQGTRGGRPKRPT